MTKTDLVKEKLNLVRKGRILKKDQIMGEIGVAEGDTINLVIKEGSSEPEQTSQPQGIPGMFGTGMPPFMGMPGMGAPGMAPPGMEMPNMGGTGQPGGMPEGFDPSSLGGGMFNPDMMSNILENPMVKGMISDLLSDPEKIQGLISANPILAQMAEGNPEIEALIKNPEKIKDHMSEGKLDEALKGMQDNIKNMAPSEGETAPGSGSGAQTAPPTFDPSQMFAGLMGGNAPGGIPNMEGNTGMVPPPGLAEMMGGVDPNMLNQMMSGFNVKEDSDQHQEAQVSKYDNKTTEELKVEFKEQLETISAMGFNDEAKNIEILKQTNGDGELALKKLMGM